MADKPFWSGGSIPNEGELRTFLSQNSQMTDQEIALVVSQYRQQVLNDPDITRDWPQMAVNSWVNQQVSDVMTDPTRTTGAADTSVNTTIAENRAAEQERTNQRFGAITQMARERLALQSDSFYDQANTLNDTGPNYGAGLATSIALGFRVDEYGAPVIDPNTGQPYPLDQQAIWEEIRGLRFNMGALIPPGDPLRMPSGRPVTSTRDMSIRAIERDLPERMGQKGKARQAEFARDRARAGIRGGRGRIAAAPGIPKDRRRSLMTPSQALAMLNTMDDDNLMRLQQEMYEAGLYGEDLPSWGVADARTRQAFIDMFAQNAQNTDEPIETMLNRLADERINRGEALGEGGASGTGGKGPLVIPDFKPEITSEATLNEQIDEIARSLRGEFANPQEKSDLVKRLQARELEVQRQNYDRDVAGLRGQAGQEQGLPEEGAGSEEIDAFMAAISGQESGGNYGARNAGSGASGKYQIMPANWPSWAQRAGLPRNAPQTPQNQEIVARRVMLDYFEQFGNWRDVAVAWYAGPGNVGLRNSSRPQRGGPSIRSYADTVMNRFSANRQMAGQAGTTYTGPEVGGMQFDPTQTFDPEAEAREILKAQDPAGWQAHEFGQRAIDFYGLLGGVVNA